MNRCVLALASGPDRASVALARLDAHGHATGVPVVLTAADEPEVGSALGASGRHPPDAMSTARPARTRRVVRTPGAGPKDLLRGIAPRRSANELGALVRELLVREAIEPAQIDRIGLATGPAAFSALRVAVALAQGLACGLRIPLVGVGHLATIAYASANGPAAASSSTSPDAPGRVWVTLDARMGDCWWAVYDVQPRAWPVEVRAPAFTTHEAVRLAWDRQQAGDGVIADRAGWPDRLVDGADVDFDAGDLVELAVMASPDQRVSPDEVRPSYLREKIALDVDEQRALRLERQAARAAEAPVVLNAVRGAP